MLEQFVVSRIVDIDILMQIWKNRVKQINFVLEWVRWVGSEIIPAKGGACKEPLPAPGNRSNERRYREKDLATTEEKKVGTGEREREVAKKRRVVKSRHGWTMYLNLVTSQYILYFKKCPIEGVE
ncbi:hypothetical protein TNCV_4433931 [Trichonephila clavipes]|nr:hypothetical protein TNCV_4433931 [Trichonephila clavipes]